MTIASAVKSTAVGRLFWSIFNWYPSTLSASDRRLLLKLDRSILIFASLSFFCKFLDQSNITSTCAAGRRPWRPDPVRVQRGAHLAPAARAQMRTSRE